MRQERGLQNIVIVVLAVAILVMSVGFATYEQSLNINGTATFTASKWDVHFDTGTFNETSTIKATTKSVGNTTITYNVTLPKPGSTYSFTVNIKNFGTIDAELKKITLSGLTTAQKKYITYKVNYAGTDYTDEENDITNSILAAQGNESATVTVTVSYDLPTAASDLPSEDAEVTLTAAFDYVDANL